MSYPSKEAEAIDRAIAGHIRTSGMLQSEVAAMVGISEAQFSRKRRGDYDWKLSEIAAIAGIVGKTVTELLATA